MSSPQYYPLLPQNGSDAGSVRDRESSPALTPRSPSANLRDLERDQQDNGDAWTPREVEEERTPSIRPAWYRQTSTKKHRWRLWALAAVGGLALVLLLGHWLQVFSDDEDEREGDVEKDGTIGMPQAGYPTMESLVPWMYPKTSLNFDHPTTLARENLRNDTFYVTGFAQAGFTNQFIAYLHLIYLGHLSGRVPIIPPIIPAAHVSETAGIIPFSSIFNLTNLRAELRTPIVEWGDVKTIPVTANVSEPISLSDPAIEHFGCWSTSAPDLGHATWVQNDENVLKLDMSFTHVPAVAMYDPKNTKDSHTTFYGMNAIISPGRRHRDAEPDRLTVMQKSRLGKELKPDEQLSCFDLVYYMTTGVRGFEFEEKWSPAWTRVGKFLRWSDSLQELGVGYLRTALGLSQAEEVPKMITVHIRRGDFGTMCKSGESPPCFIPLKSYKDAVDKVREEVLKKQGVNVTTVLVASNEDDPAFWKTLHEEYKWSSLNHTALGTQKDHGEWYPLLVDKVTLSMGLGFVGTMPSTFSVYNARRVEDWNGGVTRMLSQFTDS